MWKAIDKIGLFFGNVFTALKFAAFDYDVQLRRTKTPRQRIIIWLIIFGITLLFCYLLLIGLKIFIKNIVANRLNILR